MEDRQLESKVLDDKGGDDLEKQMIVLNKYPRCFKILIVLAIVVILGLTTAIIVLALSDKSSEEPSKPKPEPEPEPEPEQNVDYFEYFGKRYENISYDVEGKIENTFKQEGENFVEDIGNLNGGADYEKNERNIYDLYIPEYALTRQNEANGIILWIHGGAWVQGDLKDMDSLCKLFSQQGYITATVGYTILNGQYKEFNIYRILDEITACIKAIKKELVAKGFKEDKLKMAIGGYSAGGHLALLYSYLTKNIDIIPIQFIIDFAGPIGLYEEYFYKLKNGNETLENIEDISLIEQAKNEGKLELVGEYSYLLSLMNAFTGNNYTQEDLMSMLNTNGTINKNSEKYIEIDKKIKHSYITQIEDKHKIPTICVYGGTDEVLGISTYAYLKEKANKDGRHLEFIYSRYEGHGLIKPKTREGKQKMQDAIVLIMNYLKYFFTESEPGSQTSIEYYDYFGNISKNISYSVDGKIANSFKNGGDNFIEKIGNINEGDDYPANERNYYDLYIPQYALNRKDKMNGIMLWIHGGAWRGGYMGQMDFLCKLFSQQGYISATIGYTLLLDYFKVFNIYRIMDEITAAIKAIKQELIQKGFDGDKLIMGIGGYSAGGHLALLYSYLINNIDIIPIKFVVDISGPIGLHEKYFYKLENNNNTFENIDNLDAIEQAKTEGKIVKIVDTQIILSYMNAFSGNKFTQDLSSMVDENGQINEESPKYKEMFEFIKYGYVTEIEDKHKLPTIALYGGIDDVVGVSTYAYLKQKADKDERNIDFFYSRYEGHLAIIPSTEDGKETIWKFSSWVMDYFEKYFSEPEPEPEQSLDYFEYFGKRYENLPYDVEGKIENTFKQDGENFVEDIGNLNNGTDYEKNERNIYDLYIPDSAMQKLNETNGIILWIHGGAWTGGDKSNVADLCKMYAEQGYITATVGYTILNGQYKEFNIYRILDEITACIKAIKNFLKGLGFNENNLKMGIGGYSAGSHLALLYSYLIKNINIIPIKFVINMVGPIGLHEDFFYKVSSINNTLENIEDIATIEKEKNEGKLIQIFPEVYQLTYMNAFWGNRYSNEEINSMIGQDGKIKKDTEEYKKMHQVVKYAYITEIEDKHKLPTLCVYGGTDDIVGVTPYAYLKQKAQQDRRYLYLIYSRYEGHSLIYPTTEDGKEVIRNVNSMILYLTDNFFSEPTNNGNNYDYFGQKYENLPYDVEGKIENTFKQEGENFNEDIGNLNDGADYEKNERNIYDLYIPEYALTRQNEINGIILWVHGGAWIEGEKEEMDEFCKLFSQQGYISATIGYTILNGQYEEFNIYRIIDEITASIKAIKNHLIGLGFDGDKLKMAIGGYSAGGHLALLYSYLVKNFDIVPIKFVIDFVGPIGLSSTEYFYKLKNENETLENIDDISIIEQAKNEGKLKLIVESESFFLMLMNAFTGNNYTQEELMSMLYTNGTINKNSEKYIEMENFTKYSDITQIEDKHKIPTICVYGGIDIVLGISAYAYLKEKADKDGRHLDFIYSRYEGHGLVNPTTLDGKNKVREAYAKIMNYFKNYFGY